MKDSDRLVPGLQWPSQGLTLTENDATKGTKSRRRTRIDLRVFVATVPETSIIRLFYCDVVVVAVGNAGIWSLVKRGSFSSRIARW